MKKRFLVLLGSILPASLVIPVAAAGNKTLESSYKSMLPALILLAVITVAAFAICVFLTVTLVKASRSRHGKMKKSFHYLIVGSYAVATVALLCTILCGVRYHSVGAQLSSSPSDTSTVSTSDTSTPSETDATTPSGSEATDATVPVETSPSMQIEYSELSDPNNWGVDWDIIENETITDSYTRAQSITFGNPNYENYFVLPGIATFRGDNYRTGASYGTAAITNKTLSKTWTRQISSLLKPSGTSSWTGSGWTGQPLVVQWDDETKQIMNLYNEKKAKDGLVEVIYATLDGHIYFYDLEDGTYTRDPLYVGMAFKGAGALDPRGYPIFYVGSGDLTYGGQVPRMYIISLIDCTILYENGSYEPLKQRNWTAFDSSPLVDAETDTLIWPGESGLLYTIKLNTSYDKKAGTLSIDPENPVKTRYTTSIGTTLGYENSCIIVDSYLYVADNGGMLHCVDLNSMELMWSQNVKDDTNATMVFEWDEDGNGYLYTASSVEICADANGNGTVYIYKINASNGEIVWEKVYSNVGTNSSVSGGVLSSPILGKEGTDLEGLVIYSISRTPTFGSGTLVALNALTGEVVWEKSINHYAWSSPVAVYTENGTGYIVLCDSGGYVHLMEGATGTTLDTISVGANVEASPIVYENTIVVGTRGQQVYGLEIE